MENSNNPVGKRLYMGRSLSLGGDLRGSGILGMLVSTRLGILELLVSQVFTINLVDWWVYTK